MELPRPRIAAHVSKNTLLAPGDGDVGRSMPLLHRRAIFLRCYLDSPLFNLFTSKQLLKVSSNLPWFSN
ncbi:Alkaline phosphatase-like alpha/beta/alpha [Penicillium bovifimosum]|uniref:Alkaline phosphatase-like alpha/beta/alpha n=1 Tax=Penicillium bovifimosum TaxID=126998 RepID=A0A9W9GV19_9EURO|nr:Alkaline phosphatase-like alpha/beta/alpha [Penicillium bovifimosum]KAJ5130602.1 Alkaline phosphatase-like alpha/beta/alpha [Penicillium bovifimosum]